MNHTARWIALANVDDIPLREGRPVTIDGREIAVFNLGDRFAAVENRCPHRGGPLADGIVIASAIVCPLHNWRIGLEDGNVVKPQHEPACVATWPARVESGRVLIQLQPSVPADHAGCSHHEAIVCPAQELIFDNAAG